MDHLEAQEHLLDLVGGEMDESTTRGLVSHIESCEDCRSWLDTYHLLSTVLGADAGSVHPDSQTLALCALRPDEVFEEDRLELRRHLKECTSCRHDVESLRAAVSEARPHVVRHRAAWRAARSAPWKIAVAASLAAAFVSAIIIGRGQLRSQHRGTPPLHVATVAPRRPVQPGLEAPVEHLSEPQIEGTRLIEASGGLMISKTRIRAGAKVTIRAGTVVGFGDGFQIGSQAQVAIGGRPGSPAHQPRAAERGNG